MDQGTIDSYCSHYVGLNPWALYGVSTPGEVRTSDELLSEAELRKTEFYHGWMRPRGWLHTAAVSLDTTKTERAILFAMRPPNHPFTESEITLYKDLAPHLSIAARIEKRLRELKNPLNRPGAREMDILAGQGLRPSESHIALARVQQTEHQ